MPGAWTIDANALPSWVASLLDAGTEEVLVVSAGSAVPVRLRTGGHHWTSVSDPTVQHDHRFDLVLVCVDADEEVDGGRSVIHHAVQHLLPTGRVVLARTPRWSALAAEVGLHEDEVVAGGVAVVYRRTTRITVHDLLFEARSTIVRVAPLALAALLSSERPPVLLDTRSPTDRLRTGVIAGSHHVPRTVLEWSLDPANAYRHPADVGFDDRIVVLCNAGYSSSLAAANLVRLGFSAAGDLIGGVRGWASAGLPLVPPDHSHLDL